MDFESKLCKSIFYKSGSSDEIGLGEEYECGVICIEGGIVVQWCALLVGTNAEATFNFGWKIIEGRSGNFHGGPVGVHCFNGGLDNE